MEVHPIAAVFPSMREREFQTLTADIRVNGLQIPIVTFEGKIVDGRHRYDICTRFAIPMRFQELPPDTDVARIVVSLNATRRHLKASQRAEIAARLATLKIGRPGKMASDEAISQRTAAQILDVSRASVQRAVQRLAEISDAPPGRRRGHQRPERSLTSEASPVGSLGTTTAAPPKTQTAEPNPTQPKGHPSKPQAARHFAARIFDAANEEIIYAMQHELIGIPKWTARERGDALSQLSVLRSRIDQLIGAIQEANYA